MVNLYFNSYRMVHHLSPPYPKYRLRNQSMSTPRKPEVVKGDIMIIMSFFSKIKVEVVDVVVHLTDPHADRRDDYEANRAVLALMDEEPDAFARKMKKKGYDFDVEARRIKKEIELEQEFFEDY